MKKEIINYGVDGLPIKIKDTHFLKNGTYLGLHSHPAVEIVIVKNGVLNCMVNDENILVKKNQIIFINGNIGHKLSSDEANIIYIQIDLDFFKENHFSQELNSLNDFLSFSKAKPFKIFSCNEEVSEILEKIYIRYFENTRCSKFYLKAYIYELVAFMYANSFISSVQISHGQIEKIRPIVNFIDKNYKMPLNLNDISMATGYNKYALCHNFKSVTGKTIFDYINFLRINFAADKLKNETSSILEVAESSGFSSATYFNRVFKNIMGCAPREYRKYF